MVSLILSLPSVPINNLLRVPSKLIACKVAASLSVIESEPTLTITSLPTVMGVYSSPDMLSVESARKPSIRSLPSPER